MLTIYRILPHMGVPWKYEQKEQDFETARFLSRVRRRSSKGLIMVRMINVMCPVMRKRTGNGSAYALVDDRRTTCLSCGGEH